GAVVCAMTFAVSRSATFAPTSTHAPIAASPITACALDVPPEPLEPSTFLPTPSTLPPTLHALPTAPLIRPPIPQTVPIGFNASAGWGACAIASAAQQKAVAASDERLVRAITSPSSQGAGR